MVAVLTPACSGTRLQVRRVPEDGFTPVRNYQFQARVYADSLGNCKTMMVRAEALNKLHTREAPPSRLRLFDDDCARPIQFERAEYISSETRDHVRLSGREVDRFLGDNALLADELMGWLWREGMI